jgi:hypothetical protein
VSILASIGARSPTEARFDSPGATLFAISSDDSSGRTGHPRGDRGEIGKAEAPFSVERPSGEDRVLNVERLGTGLMLLLAPRIGDQGAMENLFRAG